MAVKISGKSCQRISPRENSNIDVALYVTRQGAIFAVCDDCKKILGWSWNRKMTNGFWSCLRGCEKKFDNKLESGTSSILYPDDERVGSEWVSGWLDVPAEDVEVIIDG